MHNCNSSPALKCTLKQKLPCLFINIDLCVFCVDLAKDDLSEKAILMIERVLNVWIFKFILTRILKRHLLCINIEC